MLKLAAGFIELATIPYENFRSVATLFLADFMTIQMR